MEYIQKWGVKKMIGIETTPKNKKPVPPMDKKNDFDTVENLSFNFKKFLDLCKKHKLKVDKKITKAGNTKIRNDKKIVFYVHEGKKSAVILWNNITKKSINIKNVEETKKLLKTVVE